MSATFEEAIQPLLEAHAALEADVTELEAELAALKDKRNRLRTAVRALAPERLPEDAKGKSTKKNNNRQASQVSVDYVRDFLRDHIQGEFGSSTLLSHGGYAGVGGSSLPSVFRQLHEEGFIRLVRKGKGLTRYYEVIR